MQQLEKARYILNYTDKEILNAVKETLTHSIEELKERGVRHTNIEIELIMHIKKVLNAE